MTTSPLDNPRSADEDGHGARIVRLEVKMETVQEFLVSMQQRMDEGFRSVRAEMALLREEWREDRAERKQERLHDKADLQEQRLRDRTELQEQRLQDRAEMREERRQDRAELRQDMTELRKELSTNMRWLLGMNFATLLAILGIVAKANNFY